MTIHQSARSPRLGIDIGRVIIDGSHHPSGNDTAFFNGDEPTLLATPEMPHAIAMITHLVDAFEGRVWLVSKCGPRVQQRTLRWLDAHDFSLRTGLPPDNVRFCRARVDKRLHCEELALTHFIDDRVDVHHAIRDIVDHQYLFGPQPEPAPHYTQPVANWLETWEAISTTL